MPTVDDKTKNLIEVILDILTVLVVVDIVWTFFFKQTPFFDPLHDMIAVLGTIGAGWLTWKMARKNKALT